MSPLLLRILIIIAIIVTIGLSLGFGVGFGYKVGNDIHSDFADALGNKELGDNRPNRQVGGRQVGGRPFSDIDAHIGEGVPGSYGNIVNGPDLTKPQYTAKKDVVLPTYYGHGIPLYDRAPGPFESQRLSSHYFNPKCAPECCPSPYSCDKGCLCVDMTGLAWGAGISADEELKSAK
jgi:hypothetical protein